MQMEWEEIVAAVTARLGDPFVGIQALGIEMIVWMAGEFPAVCDYGGFVPLGLVPETSSLYHSAKQPIHQSFQIIHEIIIKTCISYLINQTKSSKH
jgi:hypothetical protein